MSENINNKFFEGNYQDVWRGIIPEGLSEVEAEFITEVSGLDSGSSVLDLMCGYGRHSIPLARNGIHVKALDNLETYISEIESVAVSENLPLVTECGDIMQLNFGSGFKSAICMGNSFAFFNRSDSLALLKKISNALEPGGKLIINSWMIAEIALRHFREKDWHYAGEYRCLLDYKYEFNPSRIESEQTIISPDGNIEVVKGIDYIFTLDELEQMFLENGLRTIGLFSTPKKRKFSLGDVRIYIVAEKI